MSKSENNRREVKIARIRREIEILLHSPLREEEWEDLVEEHYVDELLNDSLTSSKVAETVRRRRRVYGQREAKRDDTTSKLIEEGAEMILERSKALSLLVADEATKDVEVQAFRTEVLGSKLLSLNEVKEWINQQAKKDGMHTLWLNIPVCREYIVDEVMHGSSNKLRALKLDISLQEVVDNLEYHLLMYGEPGPEEYEIPTFIDGVLERLRLLSERLAEQYGWIYPEATRFVLTGTAPEIFPMTYDFDTKKLPALSRIKLTIDPTLSPRDVAELYRRIRKIIFSGRYRNLSEKHLQLAIFSATRAENETWAEKMAEWNKTHTAEWKYEEVANFAHDCLQAHRRLLRLEKE